MGITKAFVGLSRLSEYHCPGQQVASGAQAIHFKKIIQEIINLHST